MNLLNVPYARPLEVVLRRKDGNNVVRAGQGYQVAKQCASVGNPFIVEKANGFSIAHFPRDVLNN